MDNYDVIAICESSRNSETSHKIQAKYFKKSGINNFTSEALTPIECYILNKYKNPDLLNMCNLSGLGTRTQLKTSSNIIFVPTDYFVMYIKDKELLNYLPPIIAKNLQFNNEGRIIKYIDHDETLHGDDLTLHLDIKKSLNNKEGRYTFWFKNIMEFVEFNKLFIVGFGFYLIDGAFGYHMRKLKGDKFLSIGMGAISNFQIGILVKVYNKFPTQQEHKENMTAPDAKYFVGDIYNFINLTKFEKTIDPNADETFIFTNELPPSSRFHLIAPPNSVPMVGSIKKSTKGGKIDITYKKYNGFEVNVKLFDAIIMMKESVYNPDMTV